MKLELFPQHLVYDGRRYHLLWLRDNCLCGRCRHENGQRLIEFGEVPENPSVSHASIGERSEIVIRWAEPAGHVSCYSREFLLSHVYDEGNASAASAVEPKPCLWDASVAARLPTHDYRLLLQQESALTTCLTAVLSYGFALVNHVEARPNAILDVVKLFGYVRETNYGRTFDVIHQARPENLAYTPMPLSLHTDNPYRDPVPTLQLLHCLAAADEGGVSALSDGFHAAVELRAVYPEDYAMLTGTPVSFEFANRDALLRSCRPMIQTNTMGEPAEIRLNNRSIQALSLPYTQTVRFYAAYRRFVRILNDGANKFLYRLGAGDLIILDNRRVLHGREQEAVGYRHLQGCYADIDGLASKRNVLMRGRDA